MDVKISKDKYISRRVHQENLEEIASKNSTQRWRVIDSGKIRKISNEAIPVENIKNVQSFQGTTLVKKELIPTFPLQQFLLNISSSGVAAKYSKNYRLQFTGKELDGTEFPYRIYLMSL